MAAGKILQNAVAQDLGLCYTASNRGIFAMNGIGGHWVGRILRKPVERFLGGFQPCALDKLGKGVSMEDTARTRASLDLLYSISRELAAQLDLNELLGRILRLTLETIGGESGSILVLDDQGKVAEGSFVYAGEVHQHTAAQLTDTLELGLAGWVVKQRQAALIENTLADERWLKRSREVHQGQTKSAISVPLNARDRIVGVLTLVHPEEGHFAAEDLTLLTTIADQAGIAVENARLFAAEQARRQFAATLQEIARSINSSLNPAQVFPLVLEHLKRVVSYDSASIYVCEGPRLRLVAAHGFEEDPIAEGLSIPNDEELLIGQVLHRKDPLVIDDMLAISDGRAGSGIPDFEKVRGWIGAPLIVRDQAVGVLTVTSQEPNAYDAAEAEMVAAFAHQAATAVANSQLYAESQRQMRAMVALAETARVVSASLDLGEVLQRILSQTMRTLEVDAASLALVEEESGKLVFTAASGMGAEQMIGIRLEKGRGIAGWVVESGEPLIVQDVQDDPRFYRDVDQQIGFQTRAMICAPIRIHSEIIGVLEAVNPRRGMFEPHQLEILMGIAGLAGTAIEHARLFAETQAARRRYAGLFEDSIDPILISDLRGVITDCNSHAQHYLGLGAQRLLGARVMDLHKPTNEGSYPDLSHLEAGVAHAYETSIAHADGALLPIEIHVKRIDVERQPILQWILRDISERKALDQLKADLTSMLFHDLRSPLGNIISSLEVMRGSVDEQDEDLGAVITVAQRSSRRLSRLIDSLLDIGLLESGKAVLNRAPASMEELIGEALEEVQPIAEAKSHRLEMESLDAPLRMIEIDVDMIRRVMINLVENAVRYTPSNGEIRVVAEQLDDQIRISVRDSGPGIEMKDRQRIFEKFARLERKSRSKGLGLGLAFCRLAIEAHGGKIWVESEPGKGSVFCFALPL